MGDITVLGWPSALHCLSWSKDGQLAVGMGDHVALLIPNLKPLCDEKKSDSDYVLHQILIRVNLFTPEDIPLRLPTEWHSLSIGDEIGVNTVVALEWSLPGLAKHHNCALAILTANCALSLWVSDSDPKVSESWRRVLLINHALARYSEQVHLQDGRQGSEISQGDKLCFQRIRSFCWIDDGANTVARTASISKTRQFLTVSNDRNNIVFIQIGSPQILHSGGESQWTAKCIGHIRTGEDKNESMPMSFEDYIQQPRHAHQLAWSSVRENNGRNFQGLLAFTTISGLILKEIEVTHQETDITPMVTCSDIEHDLGVENNVSGPLIWVPPRDASSRRLIAFGRTAIFSITFDSARRSTSLTKRPKLDDSWDQVAGVAISQDASKALLVNVASHLTSTRNVDTHLSIPLQPSEIQSTPPWQHHLRRLAKKFGAINEVDDEVLVKVWGMASSPLNDLLAVTSTCHPSHMVEYLIYAEQRTNVSLCNAVATDGSFPLAKESEPSQNRIFSAEALVLSIKHYFRGQSEVTAIDASLKDRILPQLLNSLAPMNVNLTHRAVDPQKLDDTDLTTEARQVCHSLQSALFESEASIRARCSHLIDAIGAPVLPDENVMTSIARCIWTQLSGFQPLIPASHRFSTALLNQIALVADLNDDAFNPTSQECCEICDAGIPLESRIFAKCLNGHQFIRCGMSFLAIQAPRISKQCGICRRHYFKDEYVLSKETSFRSPAGLENNLNGKSINFSLARVLFAACNVCVYCGGKFIG